MGKALKILGYVLLTIGVGIIFLGLLGIFLADGWKAVTEVMNPFNFSNVIMMAITLAPGLSLIAWGDKLQSKRAEQN
jgi:hypothetical protein